MYLPMMSELTLGFLLKIHQSQTIFPMRPLMTIRGEKNIRQNVKWGIHMPCPVFTPTCFVGPVFLEPFVYWWI